MVVRLGIRERNRRLCHPENAGRNAAQRRTKENEPLGPEPIVRVQASRVRRIPHRPENQGPFDADEADDDAAEAAGDDHQAEREGVGAVDQVRSLFAAGAERVHRCKSHMVRRKVARLGFFSGAVSYLPICRAQGSCRRPVSTHCRGSSGTTPLQDCVSWTAGRTRKAVYLSVSPYWTSFPRLHKQDPPLD